jgi:hypothetical protein
VKNLKYFTGQKGTSVSNTIINLAEVAKLLEKTKAEIQDVTDEELYVFDLDGNKVIL